jgi:hypothetical protein
MKLRMRDDPLGGRPSSRKQLGRRAKSRLQRRSVYDRRIGGQTRATVECRFSEGKPHPPSSDRARRKATSRIAVHPRCRRLARASVCSRGSRGAPRARWSPGPLVFTRMHGSRPRGLPRTNPAADRGEGLRFDALGLLEASCELVLAHLASQLQRAAPWPSRSASSATSIASSSCRSVVRGSATIWITRIDTTAAASAEGVCAVGSLQIAHDLDEHREVSRMSTRSSRSGPSVNPPSASCSGTIACVLARQAGGRGRS